MDMLEALQRLNAATDEHWTADGQPAVAAVEAIMGRKVTRAEIDQAAPNLSRPALSSDPRDIETGENAGADPRDSGVAREPEEPTEPPEPPARAEPGRPELEALLADELAGVPKDPAQARAHLERRMSELAADARLLAKLTVAVEAHYHKILEVVPDPTPQERFATDRAHYVRTQDALRANRAERLALLRTSSVDIKAIAAIVHPSQLDAALSRKSGRGANRPTFFEKSSPKKDPGTKGS